MAFTLKVCDQPQQTPDPAQQEHSLWADVTSVHFHRFEDGSGAEARLWVREPVKTALVPGFCENEKCVTFTGSAYVMNEHGRTISAFTV